MYASTLNKLLNAGFGQIRTLTCEIRHSWCLHVFHATESEPTPANSISK